MKIVKSELRRDFKGMLLHISQQFFRSHLHLVEGKPLLAEVFQRGADVINGVVDT